MSAAYDTEPWSALIPQSSTARNARCGPEARRAAAGVVAGVLGRVINAWVLLVEIRR